MYLHNFACWAAARAVQNPRLKGTKVKDIKNAIENIGLYSYVEKPSSLLEYDKIHDNLVDKFLKAMGWRNSYYGVAAKIIAIYFKVTLNITGKAPSNISNLIYPPLDSYNLKQIYGSRSAPNWTSLDKTSFKRVLRDLIYYCEKHKISFKNFEANNPFTT